MGVTWIRILAFPKHKGFGNIDKSTPEFALSILPHHRRKGLATKLMNQVIILAKEEGYKQLSLASKKKILLFICIKS